MESYSAIGGLSDQYRDRHEVLENQGYDDDDDVDEFDENYDN
jgi:hypothetical protein